MNNMKAAFESLNEELTKNNMTVSIILDKLFMSIMMRYIEVPMPMNILFPI